MEHCALSELQPATAGALRGRVLAPKGHEWADSCPFGAKCDSHLMDSRPFAIPRLSQGANISASGRLRSMVKDIGFLALHSQPEPVKRQIEHGSGIQRQELAQDEPSDNADTERLAEFGACACPKRERQSSK